MRDIVGLIVLITEVFYTDALVEMEKAMKRDDIETNDRQLACARINSKEGQDYLKAMAAAANFAWVNRSSMTFLTRQVSISQMLCAEYQINNLNNLMCFVWYFRRLPSSSTCPLMTLTCTLSMMYPTILLKLKSTWWMENLSLYWFIEK